MATAVRGVVASLTDTGTTAGAKAFLVVMTPGGRVPSSWQKGSGQVVAGPYTLQHDARPDGSGVGDLLWFGEFKLTPPVIAIGIPPITGQSAQQLNFAWNTDGTLVKNADGSTTAEPPPQTSTPVVAPSWLDELGTVLGDVGKIFTATFWQRVGIGAAGVALAVVGLFILYHEQKG